MTSNRLVSSPAACLALTLSLTACSTTEPPPTPANSARIEAVLKEVQAALNLSAAKLNTRMPPLDSVTLTLQASAVRGADGKISLLFIAFGHSIQRETTQELTVVLEPPKPARLMAPPAPSLADQLVDAVVGAVEGVQQARSGSPPLEMKSLEIVVGFVVEKDTSGKFDFTIQPVTAGLGGDMKDKAVQKLRLAFRSK